MMVLVSIFLTLVGRKRKMARSVPEWIAKHDDQSIPARVKLRVLEFYRRRCPICGCEIREGDGADFDHVTPLADGGEHREKNLRPVHRRCHRLLTARQAQERAISRTKVKASFGLNQPGPLSGSRIKYSRARGVYYDRFTGEIVEASQP